ncbi:MAG: zf-HC2 domain-containing protein [Gemmatimonadaceae bacterium]|nr:zf-HC2 domain-containing protein [Gemmatimonadaceae bacterium]
MQHLDEGTIHAWLDGELPPAEMAAAEAHVGTCDECRAAVAEARGFVAGASRILLALDAVPGGVLPASTPSSIAKTRAPRRFTLSRTWMAAAAVLVLSTVTVIAIRPKRESVVSTVAVSDELKEERADARSAASAGASAPVVAKAPAPSEKAANAPAPVRAKAPSAQAADAMVAQAQAPAPASPRARLEDTAASQRARLNGVVITGAGTISPAEKLGVAIASADAPKDAPPNAEPIRVRGLTSMSSVKRPVITLSNGVVATLATRATSAENGEPVEISLYQVDEVYVAFIDRLKPDTTRHTITEPLVSAIEDQSDKRDAKMNIVEWTDSKGRMRTLRGRVSLDLLSQLKAALDRATP